MPHDSIDEPTGAEIEAGEGARWDLYPALPPGTRSILDVGCGGGAGFASLREQNIRVVGVDVDPSMLKRAAGRLDEVLLLDLSSEPYPSHWHQAFDAVVFADVLEHLTDPWTALRAVHPLLAPGGAVVASIPNVRQIRILAKLALGQLDYLEGAGTLQRAHVRFFARRTIDSMFREAGYEDPHYFWVRESWHLRGFERKVATVTGERLADLLYGSYTVAARSADQP